MLERRTRSRLSPARCCWAYRGGSLARGSLRSPPQAPPRPCPGRALCHVPVLLGRSCSSAERHGNLFLHLSMPGAATPGCASAGSASALGCQRGSGGKGLPAPPFRPLVEGEGRRERAAFQKTPCAILRLCGAGSSAAPAAAGTAGQRRAGSSPGQRSRHSQVAG